MTRSLRGAVAGLAVLFAFGLLVGPARSGGDAGAWKAFIPDDVYRELVEREAKVVQQSLKKPDEDTIKRARSGAVMIMGYSASHAAPTAKTKAEGNAAEVLRDLIAAKGQEDRARKLAEDLASGKVGESAPAAKRNWRGDLTLTEIMDPLRVQKKGGDGIAPELQVNIRLKGALNGIEEKVRNLAGKKLSDANLDKASKELALLSYRMAVLSAITHEFPAPKKKGTPKEWQELSVDMRNASIDLAAAAQKKDAEGVFKAAGRLNSSCNQCHSSFR